MILLWSTCLGFTHGLFSLLGWLEIFKSISRDSTCISSMSKNITMNLSVNNEMIITITKSKESWRYK